MNDNISDDRNDLDDSSASRTITNIIKNAKPEPARDRSQAVYGDTDMNPNADDQKDLHHADEDEA
ncbi:MAG: hypothetical protein GIW97_00325 [Candidatus Eremiobacteraeota bacterium]|nr:hypothetical protein [Candidatus Eremiobacteraeota bacterium]